MLLLGCIVWENGILHDTMCGSVGDIPTEKYTSEYKNDNYEHISIYKLLKQKKMNKEHLYKLTVQWTGSKGNGTLNYRAYERNYVISADNKASLLASADPAFRGDKTKYNPEELLLASLSGCHMLWFSHLCADNDVIVIDYIDSPTGIMEETKNGGGKFKEVTLNPVVTVNDTASLDKLDDLHKKANELCFIANSVNFTVKHHPTGKTAGNN